MHGLIVPKPSRPEETKKFYLKLGLIKEVSRSPATNFRYFNNGTLETLKKIHSLRLQKKSLTEIKKIIG